MLKTLKFRLNVPTPYVFMLRFLKAAQSDTKVCDGFQKACIGFQLFKTKLENFSNLCCLVDIGISLNIWRSTLSS